MIKKYSIWQKIEKYMYKKIECSDGSMDSLDIFLNDGLDINFSEDPQEIKFYGNISHMKKQGKMITVSIDDYVYPDMTPFTTTIDNLLTILKEYKRLFYLEVDRIKISLEDGIVTISGD